MAKINSYIIIDFETGGLDSNVNAITECAAIAITGDDFKEIGRVDRLIQPYDKQYDKKALEITGITMSLLEDDGVPLLQVAEEVRELMEKSQLHKGKNVQTILVGHNIPFDIGFLNQLLDAPKAGSAAKVMAKHLDGGPDRWGNFQPRYIDTMTCAKQMWGLTGLDDLKDFKLGTCIARSGVELIDGHRAMNDVEATKEMFVDFCLSMRAGKGGESAVIQKKTRFRDYFRFK